MAGYFAELDENNIVKRVVSSETKDWCTNNLGGNWIQTYYSTQGKNYAGIGYLYDIDSDNFIAPKPYDSWFLNENKVWIPPIEKPSDNKKYIWNEDIINWEEITL